MSYIRGRMVKKSIEELIKEYSITLIKGSRKYALIESAFPSKEPMSSYVRGIKEYDPDSPQSILVSGAWKRPVYLDDGLYVFCMELPFEDLPLYINSPYPFVQGMVRYRLRKGA